MTRMSEATKPPPADSASRWHELAARVLDDHRLTADEGLAILRSDDSELLDLLAAAYRVRRRWFGNPGESELPDQRQERTLRRGLRLLLAIAGLEGRNPPLPPRHGRRNPRRRPNGRRTERPKPIAPSSPAARPAIEELDTLSQVVPAGESGLRAESLLLGRAAQPRTGPAAEGGRSGSDQPQPQHERAVLSADLHDAFVPRPSRHARNVRPAGLEICSGGIVGMGEEDADVVELALRLGQLQAEAVPVNFLLPIPGIPAGEVGTFPAGSTPAIV